MINKHLQTLAIISVAKAFFWGSDSFDKHTEFETTIETFLEHCNESEDVHCMDELHERSKCCNDVNTREKCMSDYKYCTNGAKSQLYREFTCPSQNCDSVGGHRFIHLDQLSET
jgi:hypothetical protein